MEATCICLGALNVGAENMYRVWEFWTVQICEWLPSEWCMNSD
jgi:hypothetical protein